MPSILQATQAHKAALISVSVASSQTDTRSCCTTTDTLLGHCVVCP